MCLSIHVIWFCNVISTLNMSKKKTHSERKAEMKIAIMKETLDPDFKYEQPACGEQAN